MTAIAKIMQVHSNLQIVKRTAKICHQCPLLQLEKEKTQIYAALANDNTTILYRYHKSLQQTSVNMENNSNLFD